MKSGDKKDSKEKKDKGLLNKGVKILFLIVLLVAFLIYIGLYAESRNELSLEDAGAKNEYVNLDNKILFIEGSDKNVLIGDDLEGGEVDDVDFVDNNRILHQVVLDNRNKVKKFEEKLEIFEGDFKKFESSIKLQQTIISYVKLRDRVFSGRDFDVQLDNFKILTLENKSLARELENMEDLLVDVKNFDVIIDDFSAIITDLTALKKYDPDSGFLSKIRYSLAKTVSVRRVDEYDQSIDGAIARLHKYMKNKDCSAMQREFSILDMRFKEKMMSIEKSVERACKVIDIDNNIMDILEDLSS